MKDNGIVLLKADIDIIKLGLVLADIFEVKLMSHLKSLMLHSSVALLWMNLSQTFKVIW